MRPEIGITGVIYFPFRTEPIRPALILFALFTGIVIIVPAPARPVAAMLLSGPAAYLALQRLRHGRGVAVQAGSSPDVMVKMCLTRRTITIPLGKIQGWQVDERDQLAVAYHIEREAEPGDPDDETRPPRLRLIVSAPLANPAEAEHALRGNLPVQVLAAPQMNALLGMRRLRRVLLWGSGLFVGLPLLAIFVFRTFFAARSLFGL